MKLKGHASLVINDPSGELLLKSSGALVAAGYEIRTLNYANPTLSCGYNPLHRIKSTTDIKRVAKMLVAQSLGTTGDKFWNTAAENAVSLVIQYLVEYTEPQYRTLYNAYHLLSSMAYSKNMDTLIAKANNPVLTAEYKSLLSSGDKTFASIIATARTSLSMFGSDPAVALTTSYDSIDFAEFREKHVALFINTSIPDMKYFATVTSVFLEQFFGSVLSTPLKKNAKPIYFLLDEASSIYFNNLQITIANIRKMKSGIMNVYQSTSQIVDLYTAPVARAITENCYAKVYMSGQDIHAAKEIEAIMGKFEYVDEKNVRHTRSLMTADEIRECKESLILLGNNKVIKSKTLPYFRQYRMNKLTKLPPYQPKHEVPFDSPPLFTF